MRCSKVIVLCLPFLMLGCGDLIKTGNPLKKSKKNNPETINSPEGSCGNFRGLYRGTCEKDGAAAEPAEIAKCACRDRSISSLGRNTQGFILHLA